MGGNEIVLVNREDLPREKELELGLKILNAPHVRGDQLGLLIEEPDEPNHVGVKIVDNNSRDYLPVCGGLTQVFGRSYRELDLGQLLDLDLQGGSDRVELKMDLGSFSVLTGPGSDSDNISSVMDSFLAEIYEQGVEKGSIAGVPSYRVGHFYVTFTEEIKRQYPDASFRPIDEYTEELLTKLQKRFSKEFETDKPNRDFAIKGPAEDPEKDGGLIFPHNLSEGLVEQSCGSGTIAVVVAMAKRGEFDGSGIRKLQFASGGRERKIGGPETTSVECKVKDGRVEKISFSHSLVELLARGTLSLPES